MTTNKALDGNEQLGWYEARHLLPKVKADEEVAIVKRLREERTAFHQNAGIEAMVQMKLLAAEATPPMPERTRRDD